MHWRLERFERTAKRLESCILSFSLLRLANLASFVISSDLSKIGNLIRDEINERYGLLYRAS